MDVEVNGDKVKSLRLKKSWSQELLAEHAAVSLRTVQRVEKEHIASLKSRLAIATALDVDPSLLIHDENIVSRIVRKGSDMKQYFFDKSHHSLIGNLPIALQIPTLIVLWFGILAPAWFISFVYTTHLFIGAPVYAGIGDAFLGATKFSIIPFFLSACSLLAYRKLVRPEPTV